MLISSKKSMLLMRCFQTQKKENYMIDMDLRVLKDRALEEPVVLRIFSSTSLVADQHEDKRIKSDSLSQPLLRKPSLSNKHMMVV